MREKLELMGKIDIHEYLFQMYGSMIETRFPEFASPLHLFLW